eukprot:Pgem_evm1s20180
MYVTPVEESKRYGVHSATLKKWANQKKISLVLTPGKHTIYWVEEQTNNKTENEATASEQFLSTKTIPNPPRKYRAIYCRVNSNKQRDDLERQKQFVLQEFPEGKMYAEISSALNFKRNRLQSLVRDISMGKISDVTITHKDRITRFGFEWFEYICKQNQVKLHIINDKTHQSCKPPNEELIEDLLAVTHSFSSKLYGNRKYT